LPVLSAGGSVKWFGEVEGSSLPDGIGAVDLERMDIALELATRGWGQVSPNPLVGAVIFSGSERVGEGFHARFASPHAEPQAIAAAGEKARGATLYVNLEPCSHHGRNPPCVDAIIEAGISRVVIAASDPNPVAAGGAEKLRAAGVRVDIGARETEARELNAPFFHGLASDRPWVTLKLAMSLDGAIASAKRVREWMTGEESVAMVHRMRANSDAIAVGIETAIIDDPHLTARTTPPPRVAPLRVVFDRSARLPETSRLATTARQVPTLLVTSFGVELSDALAHRGVETLEAGDLHEALRKLQERGIKSLLVEGGAGLAASFLAAQVVDRLVIFRAPVVLGEGSLNAFSGVASHDVANAPVFRLLESRAVGDDVMSVYAPLAR
jgi:diaminohydroxyphosphoribosylaminopyrimidine deaminase/5-amino-6-(5-phosphoribosylamino)uracil reductase